MKKGSREFPLWCSRLRMQHCLYSDTGLAPNLHRGLRMLSSNYPNKLRYYQILKEKDHSQQQADFLNSFYAGGRMEDLENRSTSHLRVFRCPCVSPCDLWQRSIESSTVSSGLKVVSILWCKMQNSNSLTLQHISFPHAMGRGPLWGGVIPGWKMSFTCFY